jgi:hypothetical protein
VTPTGIPPESPGPGGPQADPHEADRADELLAGYALRSLSGDDAAEADRLLSEHVPGCARCRETLLAFSDTVADLALGVDPVAPPETLLPRLHRELEPRTARPAPGRWVAVASGVAAILVVGGLTVSLGMRAGDLQTSNDLLGDALAFSQRPDADTARLDTAEPTELSAISAPDVDHFFLVGSDLPAVPAGFVYGVWLADQSSDETYYAGSFVPVSETTVVRVPFDRNRFDSVFVTLEREDSVPDEPGDVVWEEAAAA